MESATLVAAAHACEAAAEALRADYGGKEGKASVRVDARVAARVRALEPVLVAQEEAAAAGAPAHSARGLVSDDTLVLANGARHVFGQPFQDLTASDVRRLQRGGRRRRRARPVGEQKDELESMGVDSQVRSEIESDRSKARSEVYSESSKVRSESASKSKVRSEMKAEELAVAETAKGAEKAKAAELQATAAAATEKSAELAEDEERMNALRKGLVPAVSVEQASINRMKALRAKHGLGG